MATEYGKRLKLARKHAGLTQVALSKKTGIAQSTISSAEVGGIGSTDTAEYAQACGVSAMWLATGEGDMAPAFIANQPIAPVVIAQVATDNVAPYSADAQLLATWFDRLQPGEGALKVLADCLKLISDGFLAERATSLPALPDELKTPASKSHA